MIDDSHQIGEREQQVNKIIADYLEAERTGHAPDRDALLRQYPQLADELRSFFADREQFQRMAGPIGLAPLSPIGGEGPGVRGWNEPTLAPGETPTPLPGTTIRYFGDYELLQEIARGGMGVVYKARQVSLNRIVALKMILAGQLASPADVQRFRTEAEAAANLDHPNIVPIYHNNAREGCRFRLVRRLKKSASTKGSTISR